METTTSTTTWTLMENHRLKELVVRREAGTGGRCGESITMDSQVRIYSPVRIYAAQYTHGLLTSPQQTARPCDQAGNFLPEGSPPPPKENRPADWFPFESRIQFEVADLIYRRNQMPKTQVNELLDIWAASVLYADPEIVASSPFASSNDMLATIDRIRVGDEPWQSFLCKRKGELPANAPEWMNQEYEVWYRDVDLTIKNLLANPDFAGEMDFVPYREYGPGDERRYCDFFSGDWAWEQAVSVLFHHCIPSTNSHVLLGYHIRGRGKRRRNVRPDDLGQR